MKHFTIFIFSVLCVFATVHGASAQGCVAVRNMNSCSLMGDSLAKSSNWQFSMNFRYFESYKHFRGKHEETERVENGTQVINHDNSVLLGLLYNFNSRWGATVTVPLLYIDRSSLYEHKGNSSGERYTTTAYGMGDMRLMAYFTATPNSHTTYLIFGVGAKLPTGNYNYKDYFHKRGSEGQDTLVLQAVDQSIQPGDGGFGGVVEYDFTQRLYRKFSMYSTGSYLFNPRNTNGTLRSPNLVNGIPLSNEMSVADQFQFRIGARYELRNVQVSLGIRYEGIPVEDVFGKSDGFRRPGRILSLEPSLLYVHGRHLFGLNVPIALVRNRTQSVLDKTRTEVTGTYQHGDAAFADYLISLSYTCRMGN